MQKKNNNSQPNSSGFAYVRIALKLALEISFDTINALVFNIFKYIRIEYNICYSIVFLYIRFENETLISRYFKIILIIAYQKDSYYIFENYIFNIATLIIYLLTN